MANTAPSHKGDLTAVDDVRRVRERIADQHPGNMREHMDETNRIFEQMRVKLNLKPIRPPHDPNGENQKTSEH